MQKYCFNYLTTLLINEPPMVNTAFYKVSCCIQETAITQLDGIKHSLLNVYKYHFLDHLNITRKISTRYATQLGRI